MSYIENNLVKGEEIIFVTKLHWWAIIGPAISGFAVVFILGFCVIGSSSSTGSSGMSAAIMTFAILMAVISLIGGYLNFQSSEFGVTNRRVLIKTGLIRRKTLELNLNKLESFQIRESILGRVLGYKNLHVTGSGGTKQSFRNVANADIFRRRVVELSTGE